jgi:hypothetical protein
MRETYEMILDSKIQFWLLITLQTDIVEPFARTRGKIIHSAYQLPSISCTPAV